jgi:uncharacterized protein YjbJ (UPF0337 family)
MDENRVEGTARNIGGKLQDAASGLLGDTGTQARGKFNQAAGKLQDQYGNVIDSANQGAGQMADIVRDQPIAAVLIAAGVGFLLGALFTRG